MTRYAQQRSLDYEVASRKEWTDKNTVVSISRMLGYLINSVVRETGVLAHVINYPICNATKV